MDRQISLPRRIHRLYRQFSVLSRTPVYILWGCIFGLQIYRQNNLDGVGRDIATAFIRWIQKGVTSIRFALKPLGKKAWTSATPHPLPTALFVFSFLRSRSFMWGTSAQERPTIFNLYGHRLLLFREQVPRSYRDNVRVLPATPHLLPSRTV